MSVGDDLIKKYKDILKEHKIRKSIKLSHVIRNLCGYEKYVERLKKFRWKNKDIICTWCKIDGFVKQSEYGNKDKFKCSLCKTKFSIKAGTPFEHSKLCIIRWFYAIELLQKDMDISNITFAEKLRITQKTASNMIHRLKTFENGRYLGIDTKID